MADRSREHSAGRWHHGEVILRREVLGYSPISEPDPGEAWWGRAWLEVPVHVVEDSDQQLVTFIAPGAEFIFPDGSWPSPGGVHPWQPRSGWEGHGCLMVQRPGEHHAVWHFWDGPDRSFDRWYINLQTEFRRTHVGYDTQDLEVDFVVRPDGTWSLKDYELLPDRVAEGRYSDGLAEWIRGATPGFTDALDRGELWWDPTWADWSPPEEWVGPAGLD